MQQLSFIEGGVGGPHDGHLIPEDHVQLLQKCARGEYQNQRSGLR